MIAAHSQGRYLADNQPDDSIDVVYESGAGRFWSHTICASSKGSGKSVHWHELD